MLTSEHLNEIFSYLDEQERLTRANLIGIGIVCGMEITLTDGSSGKAIHVSKGCGITSLGYLVFVPDMQLVSYRAYTIPNKSDYPEFKDYPLWELFQAGEKNPVMLGADPQEPLFLVDKVVLLFLELKKQSLRNCSLKNCDDKGSSVTVSIKPLLIKRGDMELIIKRANGLNSKLTSSDIESVLLEKLHLPDICLPRFDVPNSRPATSNNIYLSFLKVFNTSQLAEKTATALSAAYTAFKPLLGEVFPTDPFVTDSNGSFLDAVSFLDTAPTTSAQVRFLQYYYDLFDDLLRAYNEFRWKGAELFCACCPQEGVFPHHLMLGLLYPENQPVIYRQNFLVSPAIGDCSERSREVVQLFRRMVEMTQSFTNEPGLLPIIKALFFNVTTDSQVRITPSIFGGGPLSDKAIPYYYRQNGTPPLYQLWSSEKTRRNRANQNLSYRVYEYPAVVPDFVRNPLGYDLEPYNFLRIEGHLGKNYQIVLRTLLSCKTQYRLPVEVIALRSGVYDETQTIDLSKESTRFQDLEALYDALREEVLTTLTEGIRYLYDVQIAESKLSSGTPAHALLKTHAPNYTYPAGSAGAWYEKHLTLFQPRPYIDVDQNRIDKNALLTVYCFLFSGTTAGSSELPESFYAHAVSIYYFSKLSEILPATLDALAFADFENKYQDLLSLLRYFRSEAVATISEQFQIFIPQEDLIDHFDDVLFSCKLDPIKSIHDEYIRRLGELKKKQFLNRFLQDHPGIQHKAGVPLGGTFIIVYHQNPAPQLVFDKNVITNVARAVPDTPKAVALSGNTAEKSVMDNATETGLNSQVFVKSVLGAQGFSKVALADAIGRISSNKALALDQDIRFVLGSLIDQNPDLNLELPTLTFIDPASKIISTTVNELEDGIVIADFFLPYLISSDGAAVQFVLPKIAPTFSVKIGCPNVEGFSTVDVEVRGGLPPYSIKVGQKNYQPLESPLSLKSGDYTLVIRDDDNTESALKTIIVPSRITIADPIYECSKDSGSYTATLSISGGTPPYRVNGTDIPGNDYTTKPIESGTGVGIEVVDSRHCSVKTEVSHICVKPPIFNVVIGCPNSDGFSSVDVEVKGGSPPYTIKIDDQDYQELKDIFLKAGTHNLMVRDAENRDSAPKTIIVPSRISIGDPIYECNKDSSSYTATLSISGGTPPYRVNGTDIPGNEYTSKPIESGKTGDIEIVDSHDCSYKTEVSHTCCDLPCAGIALRRGYRFWLPEPDANRRYMKCTLKIEAFSFEFLNGKTIETIDISSKINRIVQIVNPDDLNKNFEGLVVDWLQQINTLIVKESGREDWLTLVFRQSVAPEPGKLGILWIEYFECLNFNIQISSNFNRGDLTESLSFTYNREGTLMKGLSGEIVTIPAFDHVKTDKCKNTPPESLCRDNPPDFMLEKINVEWSANTVTLSAMSSGKDKPIAYLWEVQDAKPAMANLGKASFTFTGNSSGTKSVSVTAFFADNGCRVILKETIDVRL